MFNQLLFDPLYKRHIFTQRGIFGVTSPARDEIETMEDAIRKLLLNVNSSLNPGKKPGKNLNGEVLRIAMRPAGMVTGLINPSAFFSRLEHTFGIWLLIKNILRRIRVKDSKGQNVILYRYLNGGTGDSCVDEFIMALFLRGLFFTCLDDVKGYCSKGLADQLTNNIINYLLNELGLNIKSRFEEVQLKYNIIAYLWTGESDAKIKPEVKLLREMFFCEGILDLRFLDMALRTAYYIGIPLPKSLVTDPSSYETYNLLDNINKLFNRLLIKSSGEKDNQVYEIVVEAEAIPIAKGIVSICRELAVRIADSGIVYINRVIDKLEHEKNLNLTTNPNAMILLGSLDYYLKDHEGQEILNEPGFIFLQGKLKKSILPSEIKEKCFASGLFNDKNLNILKGSYIPSQFFSLSEDNEMGETGYTSYRDLSFQSILDSVYIVYIGNKSGDKLFELHKIIAENENRWFESYSIIR